MTDTPTPPTPPLPPERPGGDQEKDGTLPEIAEPSGTDIVPTGDVSVFQQRMKGVGVYGATQIHGIGRPAKHVRLRCLQSFEKRIEVLERIADGKLDGWVMTRDGPVRFPPTLKDRRDAIELLGRYAGVEKIVVEMEDRRSETGDAILARALGMMARAVASAPAGQRAGVLRDLAVLEGQLGGEVQPEQETEDDVQRPDAGAVSGDG